MTDIRGKKLKRVEKINIMFQKQKITETRLPYHIMFKNAEHTSNGSVRATTLHARIITCGSPREDLHVLFSTWCAKILSLLIFWLNCLFGIYELQPEYYA